MIKVMFFIFGLILLVFGFDFFTKSGTYFFLDTIFFPIYELKPIFEQSFFWHLRDILTIILGYKLYAKVFLLGTFLVGVFTGIKISSVVNKLLKIKDKKILFVNSLLGIVFLVLNPFIYERFISQTGIALAIFLIGLGLAYLIDFLISKENSKLYLTSIFFGISLTIMVHSIVFLMLIGVIAFLLYYKRFSLWNIIVSIITVCSININWLIGIFFTKTNSSIDRIGSFNQKNIEVFQSNSLNNLGTEITNLLLYGFWGEKYRHIYTPDVINDKWFIPGFFILAVVIFGVYALYKKQRKITYFLLLTGASSYILSLGLSSNVFAMINSFFYNNIPYYVGMREPQKLTGLVMLIYSVFFIVGIYRLISVGKKYKLQKYLSSFILNYYVGFIFISFMIIAWSPNVLFGFNNQLRIANYPVEYFEGRDFLINKHPDSTNLILPWHSYISCSWTHGKIISNIVGDILLPIDTITSDNIEINGLYSNSNSPQSKEIERYLVNKDIEILKSIGIDNIIFLNNCANYKSYGFLEEDGSLKKTFNSENLDIYKLK